MRDSIERKWVAFLDSGRIRRFTKHGLGKRVFRSGAYRQAREAKNFITSRYALRMEPEMFQDVHTFCFFIGHTKSGGTLIGSLLDAHPNALLADEIDALKYVANGFNKEQLFYVLKKGSQREAMKGRVTARRWQAYDFEVSNQWQGRYQKLQVIGDSKAGPTTRRLDSDPELLDKVSDVMNGVQVKIIQVIRNPFDPITVMTIRGQRTFEDAIGHYFNYCKTLVKLRQRLDSSTLFPVRYEDFVQNPGDLLAQICNFLGLVSTADYLDACKAVVSETPDRSRQSVKWNPDQIQMVEERIARVDFLNGYSFDN